MFKVIIAGGRDFSDFELMSTKMDMLLSKVKDKREVVVISGKAKGADTLGERYATSRNFKVEEYPANWDKYGRSAGYRRNEEMAEHAEALVAFWDGKSKGTSHMIEYAKSKGLKVRIIYY